MKPPPLLTSKFILGAAPGEDTAAQLRAEVGAEADAQINPCVFEVEVGRQRRYCCWSGGTIPRAPGNSSEVGAVQDIRLTLAGRAAMEALTALPFIEHKALVFQELRVGKTPLRQKVVETFYKTAAQQALIVFVGDLAGELDGKMGPAFNLAGYIQLDEILARHAPKQ